MYSFEAQPLDIAVVGSGIAGLGAAWLLARSHRVTLFERDTRLGGHTHTVEVDEDGRRLPVDTGFIVFNEPNYPHLTRLFAHLGVASHDTCMSFAASIDDGRVEYAGTNLAALFAQPANLLRPAFHGMLRDVLRFNREAGTLVEAEQADERSLGDFLDAGGYGAAFRDWYLLPMAAAIWSCPTASMLDFPARSLARFFANHGLLSIDQRPQWRSVSGGSHRYVERLLDGIGDAVHTGCGARSVARRERGVDVLDTRGVTRHFDHVVLACHADQALSLLEQPSSRERQVLGAFRYQPNRALLHTDPALMPVRRRVWSSWNYLGGRAAGGARAVSVSYWMNRLQGLAARRDYFVSLNPMREPAAGSLLREIDYTHPVFDAVAVRAQPRLAELQGEGGTWFCGSYHGYGFHEDAFASALDVARRLGAAAPWDEQPRQARVTPAADARAAA